MKKLFLTVGLFAGIVYSGSAQQNWEPLFNGKNLKGWHKLGGTAEYKVEEGAIVGVAGHGTPNTFLATAKEYGDFILEFEFRVDGDLNSGVQFRSHSLAEYMDGRVFGSQYEINPVEEGWTGGVYDEARRQWLYNMQLNPAGEEAFRAGEWNRARIEAVGESVRTWLNGVPVVDLLDGLDRSGFIALQVHEIAPAQQEGMTVRWRDIRIMTENVEAARTPDSRAIPQVNLIPNTLSTREREEGWQLLWDGSTMEGWRAAKSQALPETGWEIRDGLLVVQASDGRESANGGDIITVKKYGNFELTVDFEITDGANSGVKYFVDPELNKGEGSAIGCEYQILDDLRHPDAKLGVMGNRTLGSLYDLITAAPGKPFRPGTFNRAKIVVDGNHVEHWLNDVKIVEYERNNQMWQALVNYSKYRDWPDFGNLATGHILLQDHGNEVHFKNIKIREF